MIECDQFITVSEPGALCGTAEFDELRNAFAIALRPACADPAFWTFWRGLIQASTAILAVAGRAQSVLDAESL